MAWDCVPRRGESEEKERISSLEAEVRQLQMHVEANAEEAAAAEKLRHNNKVQACNTLVCMSAQVLSFAGEADMHALYSTI